MVKKAKSMTSHLLHSHYVFNIPLNCMQIKANFMVYIH